MTTVLAELKSNWSTLTGSAGLASGSAFSEAAGLVLVVALANSLSNNDSTQLAAELGPMSIQLDVVPMALLAAGLLVISAVGRLGAQYVTIRKKTEVALHWRRALVQGFLNSSYEYESTQRIGDVTEVIGQQARGASAIIDIAATALNSTLSILVLVGAAFWLDPFIATILLVGGAVLLLFLRPLSRRTRHLSRRLVDLDVTLSKQIEEVVSVARDIKLFDAGRAIIKETNLLTETLSGTEQRLHMYGRSGPMLYQTAGLLLLLLSLVAASVAGDFDVAALAGSALLLLRGLSYGQSLSQLQQNLAKAVPLVEKVNWQLAQYEANAEQYGDDLLSSVHSIELRNVRYAYEHEGPPAVTNVNLTLKEPGILGLVGPSGSGKSTIAQLILRLRTPSSGDVLVNGLRVEEFTAQSWKRSVAFVAQEPKLIHASVADNVVYFRNDVNRTQVKQAISNVGLDKLVESLPDGLDTLIGPTTHDLSGGQRQRIGIARALIYQPSLFVLDEPTSALDVDSETWIMHTLRNLGQSSIVIVITHRESTLGHCDWVVELENGSIMNSDLPDQDSKNQ